MLDMSAARASRTDSSPKPIDPFFYSVALSRQADGKIFVELTATTVDEEGPSLLSQEIARGRVATIDEALALIRAHVHIA